MLQRGGKLNAICVSDVTKLTLQTHIYNHVYPNSTIYSDEWHAYKGLSQTYTHGVIQHGQGQYADGDVCTNGIEGFWSILKRGIIGIYHYTSRKHLQKYVDEFVFRFNTRNCTESQRFNHFLQNIKNRLRYKDLIHAT